MKTFDPQIDMERTTRFLLLSYLCTCRCYTSNTPAPQPATTGIQTPQPAHEETKLSDLHRKLLIGFAGLLAGFTVTLLLIFRHKARSSNKNSQLGNSARKYLSEVRQFSTGELKLATANFSRGRLLGTGGFGTVYGGVLPDGTMAAVKLLDCSSTQACPQFMNEIAILSQFKHPNLVQLLGYSSDGEVLALVYEFVTNGTLFDHLHNKKTKLPWLTRINIAITVSQVLAFLHSISVYHRDVKSSNVLLDEFCSPKLCDLGLSRYFHGEDDSTVFTRPQGTAGYLDPEYYQCYQLSDKSDVYSFGVVLMELITGKKAVDFSREDRLINLSCYAVLMIQCGLFEQIIDPSLGTTKNCKLRRMVLQVGELAFQCLAFNREDRPCMQDVANKLAAIASE